MQKILEAKQTTMARINQRLAKYAPEKKAALLSSTENALNKRPEVRKGGREGKGREGEGGRREGREGRKGREGREAGT